MRNVAAGRAEGEVRTRTGSLPAVFKTAASAGSATSARPLARTPASYRLRLGAPSRTRAFFGGRDPHRQPRDRPLLDNGSIRSSSAVNARVDEPRRGDKAERDVPWKSVPPAPKRLLSHAGDRRPAQRHPGRAGHHRPRPCRTRSSRRNHETDDGRRLADPAAPIPADPRGPPAGREQGNQMPATPAQARRHAPPARVVGIPAGAIWGKSVVAQPCGASMWAVRSRPMIRTPLDGVWRQRAGLANTIPAAIGTPGDAGAPGMLSLLVRPRSVRLVARFGIPAVRAGHGERDPGGPRLWVSCGGDDRSRTDE